MQDRFEIDGEGGIPITFDNPMDAVQAAFARSQENEGIPVKVYRAVKYSHRDTWERYTLNTIRVPVEQLRESAKAGHSGLGMEGDNPVIRSMTPYSGGNNL